MTAARATPGEVHPDAPIDQVGIDFVQQLTLPGGLEDDPIRIPAARES